MNEKVGEMRAIQTGHFPPHRTARRTAPQGQSPAQHPRSDLRAHAHGLGWFEPLASRGKLNLDGVQDFLFSLVAGDLPLHALMHEQGRPLRDLQSLVDHPDAQLLSFGVRETWQSGREAEHLDKLVHLIILVLEEAATMQGVATPLVENEQPQEEHGGLLQALPVDFRTHLQEQI